jgi:hypothetical protein
MHQLNEAFNRYEKALYALSEQDREVAIDLIYRLASAIEIARESIEDNQRATSLKKIHNYLIKKTYKAHSSKGTKPEYLILLQKFRNELIHGKSHKNHDPEEIKTLAPFFWKVLEQSALHWDPLELSNILAYCLHASPHASFDQKKIIRVYKTIFNALDENQQINAFIELSLRIVSEPIFKDTLDSMVRA